MPAKRTDNDYGVQAYYLKNSNITQWPHDSDSPMESLDTWLEFTCSRQTNGYITSQQDKVKG